MWQKEMQENFLRVNKEAAEEDCQTTAAAESLGNGSGGFYKSDIKIRGRGTAQDIPGGTAKDPVPAQLIDMTRTRSGRGDPQK